jgi:hypothetical protein
MSSKRPLLQAPNNVRRLVLVGVVAVGANGCGNGPNGLDLNPDFMVGEWLATSLAMTSVANPGLTVELDTLGAVFTLSVQPSGRYTAILQGFGQSSSEVGKLTVDGPNVVFMPDSPPGPDALAIWQRVGDSVILDGDSDFDFNLDGTPEPATLRQVLIPN